MRDRHRSIDPAVRSTLIVGCGGFLLNVRKIRRNFGECREFSKKSPPPPKKEEKKGATIFFFSSVFQPVFALFFMSSLGKRRNKTCAASRRIGDFEFSRYLDV